MATAQLKSAGMNRPRKGVDDSSSIAGQFGAHLDALLASRDMTVDSFRTKLSEHGLDIGKTTVWNYLRGYSVPSLNHLEPMAAALELDHWQEMIPPVPNGKKRRRK